ncbi:MAG: hypothetical protein J6V44_09630 [Methanobrevibacter sp.]|nr:hypothetical protein [Methanobrevibacter sp.]
MKSNYYWYVLRGESRHYEGITEEFFIKASSKEEADKIAKERYKGIDFGYLGRVSEYFAKNMDLDTYWG